ncbi:MAG TPA: disulfide bond formation protein B [Chitinolyticbacter sp.]|nr:disulfide bond formation protein B [Chitinolyticbacter sp.]
MRWRLPFLLLFLACVGMIAFALYHQYVNWVMPCLMCVYQRLAVIAYGLVALLATSWLPRSRTGVALIGVLASAAALFGAATAAWNIRLQYGPADPSLVCGSSLPFPIDLNAPGWPEWFVALIRPVGDCSQIDFTLFGVSMPIWTLLTCIGLLAVTFVLCRLRWRELAPWGERA